MTERKKFSSYTHGEGRTATGQLISFSCESEDVEKIRQFLAENVRHIDLPVTGRFNVSKGGYGQYSRYDIHQHKYAGGGPGESGGWCYIEVLEIKNTPEGRHSIVINECKNGHGVFTEWNSLQGALKAFERYWGSGLTETLKAFPNLPDFKRQVKCGALTPWFYAIGDEELIGDYAFPEGLQDDPGYRFGQKFLVKEKEGLARIKTCMGTRYVEYKDEYHPYQTRSYRKVYFHDGSVWDESHSSTGHLPRMVYNQELWIVEALEQFQDLLMGKTTQFVINFLDGHKFIGKLVPDEKKPPSVEGDYYINVQAKDGKVREGWVKEFKPTTETPNIVTSVQQGLGPDSPIERIEIKQVKPKKGGRKWSGVFYPAVT